MGALPRLVSLVSLAVSAGPRPAVGHPGPVARRADGRRGPRLHARGRRGTRLFASVAPAGPPSACFVVPVG